MPRLLGENLVERSQQPIVFAGAQFGLALCQAMVFQRPPAVRRFLQDHLVDQFTSFHAPQREQAVRPGVGRLPNELRHGVFARHAGLGAEFQVGIHDLSCLLVGRCQMCQFVYADWLPVASHPDRRQPFFQVPRLPLGRRIILAFQQVPEFQARWPSGFSCGRLPWWLRLIVLDSRRPSGRPGHAGSSRFPAAAFPVSGRFVRYFDANTLSRMPPVAYSTTASSFSEQRMMPTGSASSGSVEVPLDVVQVQVHLPGVGMRDRVRSSGRSTTRHRSPRSYKQQVDAIPRAADADAFLAGDEREASAEFQQEPFQVPDQGLFQFGLAVLVLEVEELQQVRIPQFVLDGNASSGKASGPWRAWPSGVSSATFVRRTGC